MSGGKKRKKSGFSGDGAAGGQRRSGERDDKDRERWRKTEYLSVHPFEGNMKRGRELPQ